MGMLFNFYVEEEQPEPEELVEESVNWINNDDGVHYCPKSTGGSWIVGCRSWMNGPCFVCSCHQHGVPYARILHVITIVYESHRINNSPVSPQDLDVYTSSTIANYG